MALPQDTRYLDQVIASSWDEIRPVVVDQIFNSNALLARLYSKGKVMLDGGTEIRVPFMYDRLPGGAYSGLGPFAVTQKEIITSLRFDWKQNYVSFVLPGIDVFKNAGPHRAFDLVASQMTAARMTLADLVGDQVYNDGTDVNQITGLRLACLNTGTYGKITRGSDVVGSAIAGNVDTTGGAITLPMVNSFMSLASRGGATKPDLIVTTKTLWDALWARVQPQQRYPVGNNAAAQMAQIGFETIEINGSAVVSDSHCPSGYMFGLNTDYIEFYVGSGYDFALRGPFPLQVQDGFTAQLLLYAELAVQAPNLQFMASGLTA